MFRLKPQISLLVALLHHRIGLHPVEAERPASKGSVPSSHHVNVGATTRLCPETINPGCTRSMWQATFSEEKPMAIRLRQILQLFAVFISVASYPSFAQDQAAATPAAATTVTTTGGTTDRVAKFSGTNTIVNSILYDNGTDVGIGTTSPTATLTVDGTFTVDGISIFNNNLLLPPTGTATSSEAFDSQILELYASAFNSSSKADVQPRFEWRVEPIGNDTATPNGTLNLLATSGAGAVAETGLFVNSNGTIHFAAGQTFPGGGAFCIATMTSGGFGDGGTTFVAPAFTVPAKNSCSQWSGYTKTASTVILNTSGAACLSSTGKTLTVSVSSQDPSFLPPPVSDYIQLTRASATGSFTGGTDQGQFSGSANQLTCTSSLLTLPDIHD